jgi:hypothetical protein
MTPAEYNIPVSVLPVILTHISSRAKESLVQSLYAAVERGRRNIVTGKLNGSPYITTPKSPTFC